MIYDLVKYAFNKEKRNKLPVLTINNLAEKIKMLMNDKVVSQ